MKLTQTTGPSLGGQKPKGIKKIQPWSLGKWDLKHNKLKKNEKAEKYYTNEGMNWKHRSPNEWCGNRQNTWKRIQQMIVKMIKNLENKMENM